MTPVALEVALEPVVTDTPASPAKAVLSPHAPAVLESLRQATRSRHATLASSPPMVRLFDPTYSIPEYRAHLGRLLGLFEPLEKAVEQAAAQDDDPADLIHALQGARALREDLLAMDTSPSEIDALPRCQRLPPITSQGLRGYTYVILGSRLGGKIIVQRLRSVLGPDASYHFYGDGNLRSEAMWASFCTELEENGKNNLTAICNTAVGIFDAYAAWLLAPLPQEAS
jgi:heme oxygenase (biliverdin-IX-beta and delta-forming)